MRPVYRWPGTSRIYCKGSLVKGPKAQWIVVTCVMIAGPPISFLATIAHELAEELDSLSLTALCLLLTVFNLIATVKVATSNPGFLPRSTSIYKSESVGYIIPIRGTCMKLKYCRTCHIIRPPRATHCSECDMCVERFDHHCPWLSNCIGAKNYVYFCIFLYSSTALTATVLISCILYICLESQSRSLREVLADHPESLVILCIELIVLLFVGGLNGFHLYLWLTNQTTNEKLKGNQIELPKARCRVVPPTRFIFQSICEDRSIAITRVQPEGVYEKDQSKSLLVSGESTNVKPNF
mmetsp:Transcript_1891/g.4175  ORF Transcript_1891/g.4175 Transcript_1891/m.4175 type:complete len:296 (-) Transcript_1891:1137-2024(-)